MRVLRVLTSFELETGDSMLETKIRNWARRDLNSRPFDIFKLYRKFLIKLFPKKFLSVERSTRLSYGPVIE